MVSPRSLRSERHAYIHTQLYYLIPHAPISVSSISRHYGAYGPLDGCARTCGGVRRCASYVCTGAEKAGCTDTRHRVRSNTARTRSSSSPICSKNIELEVENMEPMRRAESRADAILAVMDAMLSCGGVRAVLVRTRQGRGIRKLLVHILRTVASFCSSFNGKSRSPW